MFEAAKKRAVEALRVAGMIHPHSGQERVVNDALDEFATEVAQAQHDSDVEAALAKSSGIDGDAGDWTAAGDGTDYPGAGGKAIADIEEQKTQQLPSADDLDAAAAEQAAVKATAGDETNAAGDETEQGPAETAVAE